MRERGLLGIHSERWFDHRAELVVWRAAVWQHFDYVRRVEFGREFWKIYIRRFQYNVDVGCQPNIL